MDTWTHTATSQTHPAQAALLPLPEYTVLQVTGPDAISFLQGQCTCDLAALGPERWLLGAHCNPKGRMHSSFTVAQDSTQTLHLRLHRSLLDHAQAMLAKYAVFSKVEISPLQALSVFAVSGETETLTEIMQQLTGETPAITPGAVIHFAGGKALVRQPDLLEMWVQATALDSLLSNLESQLYRCDTRTGRQRWRLKMISLGRAEVMADSIEKWLPQELNFQYIEGISFKKGCYTGQEVIARLHYRATLKKHMYRAKVKAELELLTIDTPVVDHSGKKVGQVIMAESVNAAGDCELLALVNDDAQQNQALFINLASPAVLEWLPLPYAIT